MALKILFIGGTGNISTACSRLALEHGHELWHLNRGQRGGAPDGVQTITADIRDPDQARAALGDHHWDAVVNWIAFKPEEIERDIALFRGRTDQYLFISSASVYQKPQTHYRITESTPLANPHWQYSRNKIACEDRLMTALREEAFPAVLVRPSHTYGEHMIPLAINSSRHPYTVIERMKQGRPVLVHGDGSSLWVLTDSRDFAKGFVGLLGLPQSIGHAFHITSDEVLSWDQIYRTIGQAIGVEPKLFHLSSDFLAACQPDLEGSLTGDKAVSAVFDNSKIKTFVPDFQAAIPFAHGIREVLARFEEEPDRQKVDEEANAKWDRWISAVEALTGNLRS